MYKNGRQVIEDGVGLWIQDINRRYNTTSTAHVHIWLTQKRKILFYF